MFFFFLKDLSKMPFLSIQESEIQFTDVHNMQKNIDLKRSDNLEEYLVLKYYV